MLYMLIAPVFKRLSIKHWTMS